MCHFSITPPSPPPHSSFESMANAESEKDYSIVKAPFLVTLKKNELLIARTRRTRRWHNLWWRVSGAIWWRRRGMIGKHTPGVLLMRFSLTLTLDGQLWFTYACTGARSLQSKWNNLSAIICSMCFASMFQWTLWQNAWWVVHRTIKAAIIFENYSHHNHYNCSKQVDANALCMNSPVCW